MGAIRCRQALRPWPRRQARLLQSTRIQIWTPQALSMATAIDIERAGRSPVQIIIHRVLSSTTSRTVRAGGSCVPLSTSPVTLRSAGARGSAAGPPSTDQSRLRTVRFISLGTSSEALNPNCGRPTIAYGGLTSDPVQWDECFRSTISSAGASIGGDSVYVALVDDTLGGRSALLQVRHSWVLMWQRKHLLPLERESRRLWAVISPHSNARSRRSPPLHCSRLPDWDRRSSCFTARETPADRRRHG